MLLKANTPIARFITILCLIVVIGQKPGAALAPIPLTSSAWQTVSQDEVQMPTLNTFIQAVAAREDTGALAGLYVPDKFAYPVVQQPAGYPAYVSEQAEVVTQFGMAAQYNSTGLLAHNYLAGSHFFDIQTGDYIDLVYDDGRVAYFWVVDILQYQALSPSDPYSNFVNLKDPGQVLSSTDVFLETYGKGLLVLQTCIQKDNEPSWGRLFILAVPVTFSERHPYQTTVVSHLDVLPF